MTAYELFGAKELDWYEIPAKIQHTLGIRVRHEPIEPSAMVAALTVAGGDRNRAHHLGMVTQDYRDGFYSGFNNLVEEITGSKPTIVEDHVRATRASFEADGELAITDAKLSAI